MNKVMLAGNVGGDPETRTTGGGTVVSNFSVATRGWGKDAKPDWHKVVAFGKTAELVAKFVKKGSFVMVEGRVSYETYEKDGETKYVTKIVADQVEFGPRTSTAPTPTGAGTATTGAGGVDDDIPF